jgi:hypothetical protein
LAAADLPAGTVSPLTTKGDLYAYGAANVRLPAGANGQLLKADPAPATGLSWAFLPGEILAVSNVPEQKGTTSTTPAKVGLTTDPEQEVTFTLAATANILVFLCASYTNTTAAGKTGQLYCLVVGVGSDRLTAQAANPFAGPLIGLTGAVVVSGLAAGTYTVRMHFATPNGGQAYFSDRTMVVSRVP